MTKHCFYNSVLLGSHWYFMVHSISLVADHPHQLRDKYGCFLIDHRALIRFSTPRLSRRMLWRADLRPNGRSSEWLGMQDDARDRRSFAVMHPHLVSPILLFPAPQMFNSACLWNFI